MQLVLFANEGAQHMSKIEIVRKLYVECKDMDIDETLELILSAESEEEKEFYCMISDFILQSKQKKVIDQKRF